MASDPIRVLAWSELSEPKDVYPNGISGALAEHLQAAEGITAKTASLDDPDQGVSDAALAETDVLLWFGHVRHGQVSQDSVDRILRHVKERGMGFLPLHSSHYSKPLQQLTGTSGSWRDYVENGKSARLLVVDEGHPITQGVSDFTIPQEEWYGEPYDVPTPDAVVLVGLYDEGREVARDGITWTIGNGRVFYFRPGHETYPIYFMPEVRRILENGVRWCAKRAG
jgi:trehalose utilization protein